MQGVLDLKKFCTRSDALFAAHPAVRRSFRAWEKYVREAKAAGNRYITTPGTYGTNPEKPTSMAFRICVL